MVTNISHAIQTQMGLYEFITFRTFFPSSFHAYTLKSPQSLQLWQFYESALNDHENAFRNITKTHFKKCIKTHGKSLQKRIDLKIEDTQILC